MTRYEAYIGKDWRDHGLAQLVVARIREGGSTDIGVFLLDVWCLGVKDALGETAALEADLRKLVDEQIPAATREPIHPTCAKKLIDGAIAYAETLGFAPHRDFRKARRVLSGLEASLCPTEFTYGRAGRPCFVQGPNDTDERVERVLAILKARCGPDGFDYEFIEEAEQDDSADDAREALVMFFNDEPEGSPSFHEFSGLVTAMLICPTVLSPAKVMELLWGPAGRVWQNEDELQDFYGDVCVYWNFLASLVVLSATAIPAADKVPPPDPIDIYEEDFTSVIDMVPALMEWTCGFLRATETQPESWGDALTSANLAPHWAILRAWANPDGPGNLDLIKGNGSDTTIRNTLPRAVTALARALRPPSQTQS